MCTYLFAVAKVTKNVRPSNDEESIEEVDVESETGDSEYEVVKPKPKPKAQPKSKGERACIVIFTVTKIFLII